MTLAGLLLLGLLWPTPLPQAAPMPRAAVNAPAALWQLLLLLGVALFLRGEGAVALLSPRLLGPRRVGAAKGFQLTRRSLAQWRGREFNFARSRPRPWRQPPRWPSTWFFLLMKTILTLSSASTALRESRMWRSALTHRQATANSMKGLRRPSQHLFPATAVQTAAKTPPLLAGGESYYCMPFTSADVNVAIVPAGIPLTPFR